MRYSNFSLLRFFPYLVLIIFTAPLFAVLASLFGVYSENWFHLFEYVLFDYVNTTITLVIGVSVLVFLIGTTTAWIVTNYEFVGRNVFEWALILPLAMPPYVMAYTFTGLFDPYGDANTFIRDFFQLEPDTVVFPNIRNVYGAIIVFSFTLYPYVYLVCRSAFLNQSKSMKEAARILGLSQIQVFYSLALPIARPAVIGGLVLAIMETLSDFGAVDHFAIQTFTTGIFRTWYGMYDLNTAMQLASFLLLTIGILFLVERSARTRQNYTTNNSSFSPQSDLKLTGINSLIAFSICFLPLLIGFILPILELVQWAYQSNLAFFNQQFFVTAFNTLSLALCSGVICAYIALLINFSSRVAPNQAINKLSFLLSIGYTIPGLILAVGLVQLYLSIDNSVLQGSRLFLTGSLVGLVLAYVIKTYASANSSIESGYERLSKSLDNSARVLGSGSWTLLRKIHMPLLKTSIFTSILLVMSDVVKELPATLILRPFNFDTLAVSTYIYAAEERMYQAAAPAIAIVVVGLIPIILLTKMIRESRVSASSDD